MIQMVNLKMTAILLFLSLFYMKSPAIGMDKNNVIIQIGYSDKLFVDIKDADARASTKVMTELMIAKKGVDAGCETYIFHDLQSIKTALQEKKLDAISLPAVEYLELVQEVPLDPVSAAVIGGKVTEKYVLLVHRDNNPQNLKWLKNKEIIFGAKWMGSLSKIWIDDLLIKDGLSPIDQLCSKTKNVSRVSQAVLPVFFKQADACIVTQRSLKTMVELNPQIGRELVALATSPDFLNGMMCFRKDYDEKEYRSEFRKTIFELHLDPKGKQFLNFFKMDKLVPFEPSFLESTQALVEEYRRIAKVNEWEKTNRQ